MATNIYTKLLNIQNEVKKPNDSSNHSEEILKSLNPLLEKYKLTLLLSNDTKSFVHEKIDKEHLIKYLKKVEIIDNENPEKKLFFNFWAVGSNVDLDKAKIDAENCAVKSMFCNLFLVSWWD